jgi:hypothetical protein
VTAVQPAMALCCLVGAETDTWESWVELLAPEVEVRALTPGGFTAPAGHPPVAPAGRTPVALLGAGRLGVTAFELAASLEHAGRGPARLILCDCPPPAPAPAPLSCPIIALASPDTADDMASWRTATTGAFTLRLLGDLDTPPHGRAHPDVALALKEELQVWPY